MSAVDSTPVDGHLLQIWFKEPSIPDEGVLTKDGLVQIANHKYHAGSYTLLDTYLSPRLWQPLTDMLPLWLAPNVVTTIGGTCCLLSFLLSTWYLSASTGEESENVIPRWLYISNGLSMFLYYTFDCMDGKQARRTGSSSPLGQLFDHGMDCVCNLSHLQLVQCITLLPPRLLVILQCSLQFTFWQAQWEEYYTGILPHATGDYCGVTEVNYGLALWTLSAGVFGPQLYRMDLISSEVVASWNIPALNWIVAEQKGHGAVQVRHAIALGWALMIGVLLSLSWARVYKAVTPQTFASAMSKLVSPLLLCVVSIYATDSYHHYVPSESFAGFTPSCWLALGLCFCLITIKIIVYSMAKMAYAAFQADILPFLVVVLGIHLFEDGNSLPVHSSILFAILDLYYFARLFMWIRKAIFQLCGHLKIQLFRIKVIKAQ
jgi:ethanolaminephosphotransferase